MSLTYIVELRNVTKQHSSKSNQLFTVLKKVNLQIHAQELVVVVGKSGSGKSTLLNLITGLERPTSGSIESVGMVLQNLSEDVLARWRGRNVGIVFQFFQLLPTLTVLENVMLAMDFREVIKRSKRRARAFHILEQVGIAKHAYKLPNSLSGGEQQRAAIARAIANDPPLLVADEPTGNLDSHNTEAIFRLFSDLVRDGTTLLMVTHDEDLAQRADRVIRLVDGQIVSDSKGPIEQHLTFESDEFLSGGNE